MIATTAADPFAAILASPGATSPTGIAATTMPSATDTEATFGAMLTAGPTTAPAVPFRGTLMTAALPIGTLMSAEPAPPPGGASLLPPGFLSGIAPSIARSATVMTMPSSGVMPVPVGDGLAVAASPLPVISPATPASPFGAIKPPLRELARAATPLVAAPLPDLVLRVAPDAPAAFDPVVEEGPDTMASVPVVPASPPDLVLPAMPDAKTPPPSIVAAPQPDLVLQEGPMVEASLPGKTATPSPESAEAPVPPAAVPRGLPDPLVSSAPAEAPSLTSDPVEAEAATTADTATLPGGSKSTVARAKPRPMPQLQPVPMSATTAPLAEPVLATPAPVTPSTSVSTHRAVSGDEPPVDAQADKAVPTPTPQPPAMVAPPLPPVVRDIVSAALATGQTDAIITTAGLATIADPDIAPVGSDAENGDEASGADTVARAQPAIAAAAPVIARPAEPVVDDRLTRTATAARIVTTATAAGGRTVREDATGGEAKSIASPVTSLDARSFAALVEQKTAPAPAASAPLAPALAEARVTAEPGRMGQEMGVAIARHAAEGGGEALTVRLNPAEFGRIDVTLSFDDRGTLRAAIAAESPAALDLLRRDSADLGRALTDAGMRTDAQSFRFDARQGGADAGGQGAQGGQRWQQASGTRGNATTTADTQEPEYRPLRTRGRVDLMA